jgi:hypothetical protein
LVSKPANIIPAVRFYELLKTYFLAIKILK